MKVNEAALEAMVVFHSANDFGGLNSKGNGGPAHRVLSEDSRRIASREAHAARSYRAPSQSR